MTSEVRHRTEAPLLERTDDLAQIAGLWRAARGGRGGIVVVEGPPGIGKSRLLNEACAAAAGGLVLHARAGELEQDYPWGVVRQLLERVVVRADPERRAALLDREVVDRTMTLDDGSELRFVDGEGVVAIELDVDGTTITLP